MPAAAHVETPITHSSAMGGLLAGVLIGAAIGAAVVATGGAAAIVIAGAAATGASLGGMAGKFLGGLSTSVVGKITTGSPNVFIHRKPAAFCSSEAECRKHPGPAMVAQGSSTVGINGRPAARTGDKGVCGFEVGEGSPRVTIGGAPAACAEVASEVPWWADAGLMVLGLAGGGLLLRGAGYGLAAIGARLGGSMIGGYAGSEGGHYAGGAIFGEGSTGQSVMAFGGGMVGGWYGFKGGARLDAYPRANPFNYRPYVRPNTLGANGGNVGVRYAGPTQPTTPAAPAAPRAYGTPYRQLSQRSYQNLQAKVANRTITREEYQRMRWHERLTERRQEGIDRFWEQETDRLLNGQPGTRNWNAAAQQTIMEGGRPRGIFSHHRYSVSQYPQLANDPSTIYPVTFREHFYRWHGGNWRNPSHGAPVNPNFPPDF